MKVRDRADAPTFSRGDGVESSLLHPSVDPENEQVESDLTITWVEVEPGSSQERHSHPQTQVYVIIEGAGRMYVGDDEREVKTGDLVHVPGHSEHGIDNTGDSTLQYISAAAPSIPLDRVEEFYES